MPNTSVHFPDDLLDALGRAAARDGISRNRLIVRACRELLAARERDWPDGFFARPGLSEADRATLLESMDDFDRSIAEARSTERSTPF